ncbi:hypothetical protein X777_04482 [Ooceraea biroi]|uniref:MEIOB-like N-terminal domain-containing protein n=1 Tax=Ooceraea biroi TaxID=2015173 RepID=A0A026WGC1_OOCBI|nr:hypothetical protein X777_04482 [Ooceraea biroi]
MSFLYRQEIKSLQDGTQNTFVIGVIISSANVRTFDATRTKFHKGERSVWAFTLRDSDEDFINVTVWGSTEFVKKLSSTFTIGSVVEVISAKIAKRQPHDKDERFVPSTSSPYSLIVNEGAAVIQCHDAPTRQQYVSLLTRPVKSVTFAKSLKAILDNIEALCDRFVDLLVVVTFVIDKLKEDIPWLILRRKGHINICPKKYFNIKIRTLAQLTFYALTADTVTTVMTIQQVTEKLQKKALAEDERLQFATIVKASVIEINLDGPLKTVVSIKCALCKRIVADVQDSCMNLSCPSGNGMRAPSNTVKFNVKVNLKDDTGYLIGCRLIGDVAERVLGCTVDEFQAMTVEERNELKWMYLLEKYNICLHILGPTPAFPRALYNILSIQHCANEKPETETTNEYTTTTDFQD